MGACLFVIVFYCLAEAKQILVLLYEMEGFPLCALGNVWLFLLDADWMVNLKTVIGPQDWCDPEGLAAARAAVWMC